METSGIGALKSYSNIISGIIDTHLKVVTFYFYSCLSKNCYSRNELIKGGLEANPGDKEWTEAGKLGRLWWCLK